MNAYLHWTIGRFRGKTMGLQCLGCGSSLTVFAFRERGKPVNMVLGCPCCNLRKESGCQH